MFLVDSSGREAVKKVVRRGSDPVEGRIPNNGDARPLIRQIVGCEQLVHVVDYFGSKTG